MIQKISVHNILKKTAQYKKTHSSHAGFVKKTRHLSWLQNLHPPHSGSTDALQQHRSAKSKRPALQPAWWSSSGTLQLFCCQPFSGWVAWDQEGPYRHPLFRDLYHHLCLLWKRRQGGHHLCQQAMWHHWETINQANRIFRNVNASRFITRIV